MSDIAKRLRASVGVEAHHGTKHERCIVGLQMQEAAKEIDTLTAELAAVKKERDQLMDMSITGIRMMKIVRDGMQTIEQALAEIDKETK